MRSLLVTAAVIWMVLGMTYPATPRDLTERLLSSNAIITNGSLLCSGTFRSPVLVLTAHHCTEGAKAIVVYSRSGASGIATVVNDSVGWDLALLRLKSPLPGSVPIMGQEESVSPGDEIWVIGNPDGEPFMAFHGYVAKVLPKFQFISCSKSPTGAQPHEALFLDSRTYPGNSGGGVFDASGHLIGVLVGAAINADCGKDGGEEMWAIAVGPHSVAAFLGENP